jgi:carbamoyl-phosphate synthase large subunit
VTAVLFTCAGQRVDIVGAFGRAGATTIAADVNPLAPALYHADRYELVPRIDEAGYVPALRRLVDEHGVQLIVPLTDLDQAILARSRDELGALVLLPDADVVEHVADKYLCHVMLQERGVPSPPTWLPEEVPDDVGYPLLVKARTGFGSRHIYRAADRAELDFFLGYTPMPSIVQACLAGEEFSIDVFCDLEGRCLNAIPRSMLESRGGESIKGVALADPELIELGRAVAEALPLRGPATVQMFRDAELGLCITDVNARFGGAFACPMYAAHAGRTYPELIVRMAEGERIEPHVGEFLAGRTFTRFFWQIELDEHHEPTGRDIVPDGPRPPR